MKTNLNPDEQNILSFYFNTDNELNDLILKYQSNFDILSVTSRPSGTHPKDSLKYMKSFVIFFIRKS